MHEFDTRHRIISADARDLGGTPDSAVDLVVTSPPYPMIPMWDQVFGAMNRDIAASLAKGAGEESFELMHAELDKVWEGLARVVRPGGWVCVNMGDAVRNLEGNFRLYSNHARVEQALLQAGFEPLPPVVWRKASNSPTKFMGSGMLPAGAYVTLEHEFILIFRKPDPDQSWRKEALKGDWPVLRRRSAIFWEERNVWFSDLWELGGSRQTLSIPGSRERSAAFPLELPYRLIAMFSVMGDTVLDPFCGTGTTHLASMALGRNSLGMDIDPVLVDHARQRLIRGSGEAAARSLRRLEDHRAFLAGRKVAPRYQNAYIDMPVVTRQEMEMQIPLVSHAFLVDDHVSALHRYHSGVEMPHSVSALA